MAQQVSLMISLMTNKAGLEAQIFRALMDGRTRDAGILITNLESLNKVILKEQAKLES